MHDLATIVRRNDEAVKEAKAAETADLVARITEYEMGEMSDEDVINLFQELVNSDLVWSLQGHYGRTASALIQKGLVKHK